MPKALQKVDQEKISRRIGKYVGKKFIERQSRLSYLGALVQKQSRGVSPGRYIHIISAISQYFGLSRLAKSKVLEFGASEGKLCDFLREKYRAQTSKAEKFAQDINIEFRGKKFDLILGANVFEEHAFVYTRKSQYHDELTLRDRDLEKAQRQERAKLLAKLAAHLNPGGKIILTGVSSKIIFHPNEITKAGLKIEANNSIEFGYPVSVYTRPF